MPHASDWKQGDTCAAVLYCASIDSMKTLPDKSTLATEIRIVTIVAVLFCLLSVLCGLYGFVTALADLEIHVTTVLLMGTEVVVSLFALWFITRKI